MFKKAVCAVAILAFSVGMAMADEFFTSIRKIDGDKISVAKYDRKEKKLTDEKTLTLASTVKVVKGKYNKEEKKSEAGEVIKDGLKDKRFQNIGKRGVRVVLITNSDNQVTEIRVMEFKGKGKKKKKDV